MPLHSDVDVPPLRIWRHAGPYARRQDRRHAQEQETERGVLVQQATVRCSEREHHPARPILLDEEAPVRVLMRRERRPPDPANPPHGERSGVCSRRTEDHAEGDWHTASGGWQFHQRHQNPGDAVSPVDNVERAFCAERRLVRPADVRVQRLERLAEDRVVGRHGASGCWLEGAGTVVQADDIAEATLLIAEDTPSYAVPGRESG